MKKLVFIVVVAVGLIFMPFGVDAASVSVSLECPSAAKVGSEILCKVNVTSDVMVNGLSGNYTLSGLSYVGFAPQNGFTTYSASSSGFAVGNNSGKSGTFTIGVITLKVNAAGSIQVRNLDASDTSFNSYDGGTKSASVRLLSTNDSLGSLSLSNGTLSPTFAADTFSYTATIDAASVTINATKGDNYQTISGTGVKSLNYGTNTFKVVATSEAGDSKTYTITITRPDNRSTNSNLKSLSISQGSISFNKNTTKYNVSVGSDVTSIKVTATLEDGKASFASGLGSRMVNLNYGNNAIVVKVIAENGSTKSYTINVNRKDDRSTNNDLKSLTVSSGEIVFNKETLEYNFSVYYDVTKIEVKAVAEDSKAKVVVDSPELVVGDNVITISVTSENEVVKTYKINVRRLSEEEKMSDNNKISDLKIAGHAVDFSNDVYQYDVVIGKDEDELLFDIVLEDEKASYVIEGNKGLKNGSVVTVITVSESGIKQEYEFTIEKKSDVLWYIVIGVCGAIVGFVLGLIVGRGSGKKSGNDKNSVDVLSAGNAEETVNGNEVSVVSSEGSSHVLDKNEVLFERMKEKLGENTENADANVDSVTTGAVSNETLTTEEPAMVSNDLSDDTLKDEDVL